MVDDNIPEKILDCSGLCCSMPLVEARLQLDKMEVEQTLEVISTCPSSEKDIQIFTRLKSNELVQTLKKDNQFHSLIKKVQ